MKIHIWNRLYIALAALAITSILLTSCSSGKPTGNSLQQTAQANTNEAAVSTQDVQKVSSAGIRTEQVFDYKKYSDKFSIWLFYMDANTKTGDSMLLRSPDGVTMLIDAGVPECGDTVLQNIKKLGIQKLDYVTVTHMHVDHIGGLSRVLNNIPAGKLLASNYYDYKSKEAIDLKNTLKAKNISSQFVKEGDTFQLGSEIKVEVLNPQESDGVIEQADNIAFLNNRSVVYKITSGSKVYITAMDSNILVTSDGSNIEVITEKDRTGSLKP